MVISYGAQGKINIKGQRKSPRKSNKNGIYSIKDYSCTDRLKYPKLPSLKARRLGGDLKQTFKIFNGFDKIDVIDVKDFFKSAELDTTRNSSDKIFKPFSRNMK